MRKKQTSHVQQLTLSFEEAEPAAEHVSTELMGTVSLTPLIKEDEIPDRTTDTVCQSEYNREEALARLMQIGEDLGINDNYWRTSWNNESDEVIQKALPIWEEYYEDVQSGRKIPPKIGGRSGKYA
jgi:hypothetical protein